MLSQFEMSTLIAQQQESVVAIKTDHQMFSVICKALVSR